MRDPKDVVNQLLIEIKHYSDSPEDIALLCINKP